MAFRSSEQWEQMPGCFWKQPLGMVKPDCPHLGLPFQVDPACSHPLLLISGEHPWKRVSSESYGHPFPIIIFSAACSQREEISYKPCPHPTPQSTYKHEATGRKAVFAQNKGASVTKVASPVTDVAAEASQCHLVVEKPPFLEGCFTALAF